MLTTKKLIDGRAATLLLLVLATLLARLDDSSYHEDRDSEYHRKQENRDNHGVLQRFRHAAVDANKRDDDSDAAKNEVLGVHHHHNSDSCERKLENIRRDQGITPNRKGEGTCIRSKTDYNINYTTLE